MEAAERREEKEVKKKMETTWEISLSLFLQNPLLLLNLSSKRYFPTLSRQETNFFELSSASSSLSFNIQIKSGSALKVVSFVL